MQSAAQVDRPLGVVNAVNTATPALWMVHVDHLNRPVRMTDSTKAAVWDAIWLPWGGVHSITGTATLNARFPGQWFQTETGLHYNWHRQYDPTLGRYTQPDPLGFVDGPSVYAYAGGLPQSLVDLDGENARLLAWLCSKFPSLCNSVQFDGPSPGLRYGNGRVCQVRFKGTPVFRVDYQPFPGTSNQSRLHYHIAPDMGPHRCLDPRGCGK
jgi:RHS repeat-associated protein